MNEMFIPVIDEAVEGTELHEVVFNGTVYSYTERGVGGNHVMRMYPEYVQKEMVEGCMVGKLTRYGIAKGLGVNIDTVNKWVDRHKEAVCKISAYQQVQKIDKFINKLDRYKMEAGDIDYKSSIKVKNAIKSTVDRLAVLIPDCEDVGQLATALKALMAVDIRLDNMKTSPKKHGKFIFYQYIDKQIVDKQLNVEPQNQIDDGDSYARPADQAD